MGQVSDEIVSSGIKYRQLGRWGKQPFSGASMFAWNAGWQAGRDRSELKISLSFGSLEDNLAQSPPSADGETKAQRNRLLHRCVLEQRGAWSSQISPIALPFVLNSKYLAL